MLMAARSNNKMQKVMHEFKTGTLHTGSKKGPIVKSRKQAIAIAMSESSRSKNKSTKTPARRGKR
jgi:hypothetical protein